jgi:putative membrane protein
MTGWHDGAGIGWAGWVVMTLMMLAFWGLLLLGALAVVRSARRDSRPTAAGRAEAQRLLDERLARGEIDADDYRTRRELLRSAP